MGGEQHQPPHAPGGHAPAAVDDHARQRLVIEAEQAGEPVMLVGTADRQCRRDQRVGQDRGQAVGEGRGAKRVGAERQVWAMLLGGAQAAGSPWSCPAATARSTSGQVISASSGSCRLVQKAAFAQERDDDVGHLFGRPLDHSARLLR